MRELVRLFFIFIFFLSFSCSKKEESKKSTTNNTVSDTTVAHWIKQLGGESFGSNIKNTTGSEEVANMVQDKDGNIIIAGNTNKNLKSQINENGSYSFILKIDSNGKFLWLVQFDQDLPSPFDPTIYNWLFDVTVDDDGNIFATGITQESTFESNAATDDSDIYIIKLNANGEFIWGKQFGETAIAGSSGSKVQDYVESIYNGYVVDTDSTDYATSISVDNFGNIYLGGYTYGAWLGTNGGSSDTLMIKLDSVGDVIWVKQVGSEYDGFFGVNSTAGSQEISKIVVDNSENIYATMTTSSNFGEARSGFKDCVIMKFGKFGNLRWVKQLGAGTFGLNALDTSAIEECNDIAIDSNLNVYVTGSTKGNLNEVSGGAEDIFIMKLSTDGNFEWLKHFGDQEGIGDGANLYNTDGADIPKTLFIDQNNIIYIGGNTSGALVESNDSLNNDSFILSMNTDGSFNWVKQIGPTTAGGQLISEGQDANGNEQLRSLVVDSSGNIFVAGTTDGSLGETNGGVKDIFIFKLDQN